MITNAFNEYKNEYAFDNVYGHLIEILKRNLDISTESGVVHLDIGCGYGAIAEHITGEVGRVYVGIDANKSGLKSLKDRGFETHEHFLESQEDALSFFERVIGDRKLGSISMLDTLEHLPNGLSILKAIATLASKHSAMVAISVPNIQHRDIGFKLALGSIAYTDAGLLDHTHVMMYDYDHLDRVLRHAGLRICDQNHVRVNHSDQFFPRDHPVLQNATTIRTFLKYVRANVNDQDQINQFVVAALPCEPITGPTFEAVRDVDRPFLSIVTRTQGKRIHTLVEYFTCLAGQVCRDFEVFVVGHRLSLERQIAIEQVIEDLPLWLRDKTKLIRVDHGNRTHPLNVGFAQANGRYIAIHDDDDIPMGHWVDSFRKLAIENDGALLRCVSSLQHVETVSLRGRDGVRSIGKTGPFPSEFDFIQHLSGNYSPNNTLAFPRGVFHHLNMRFDENLTTTEDWDYIMRVASVVGVASSPEITGTYQWWEKGNSLAMHTDNEWALNKAWIQEKLDARPILIPAGTVRKILSLWEHANNVATQLDAVSHRNAIIEGQLGAMSQYDIDVQAQMKAISDHVNFLKSEIDRNRNEAVDQQYLLREIGDIIDSTSWKLSAPMRWPKRILGARSSRLTDHLGSSVQQLQETKRRLLSSRSWRATRPMRAVARLFKVHPI
ncbi:methyltransferase domain-containing protein [Mesorhizobium japonicum]|uniref:Putative O-antigen methyl transferase n=1 Tax=Mesorhizobium japonicum (strain LMG 29417 / CECT 9101 / MAFF 303099) TaxID=266835 RepID=Q986I5_RHILO|nr:methyltransferase domain-containing protein [Mesorhizobium japonicum]BAB53468.1 putative O-antigen methyl transferase [Mesorhizobium japonicum MAFF 303099]